MALHGNQKENPPFFGGPRKQPHTNSEPSLVQGERAWCLFLADTGVAWSALDRKRTNRSTKPDSKQILPLGGSNDLTRQFLGPRTTEPRLVFAGHGSENGSKSAPRKIGAHRPEKDQPWPSGPTSQTNHPTPRKANPSLASNGIHDLPNWVADAYAQERYLTGTCSCFMTPGSKTVSPQTLE